MKLIKTNVLILPLLTTALYGCGGGGGGGGGTKPSTPEPTPLINYYSPEDTNISRTDADIFHDAGYKGAGIVAVIDSGSNVDAGLGITADYNHIGETSVMFDEVWTKQSENTDPNFDDFVAKSDDITQYTTVGHGDQMAQVIGSSYNEIGIAPDASILHLVNTTTGTTNEGSMWKGLEAANNNNALVANISFSMSPFVVDTSDLSAQQSNPNTSVNMLTRRKIHDDIIASGMAIVHSAGNEGNILSEDVPIDYSEIPDSEYYSDNYKDIYNNGLKDSFVAVGALNESLNDSAFWSGRPGDLANFQERFILAPGTYEIMKDGSPEYAIGTSPAAAQVSASVSLLYSRWSNKTGKELLQILLDTASKDLVNYNPYFHGQGKLDLERAFQPIGATSIPLGNASLPMSAASFQLPAGYGDMQISTSFVDSYNRDFKTTFTAKSAPYRSTFFSQVGQLAPSAQTTKIALNGNLTASFANSNTLSLDENQMSGVEPFGYNMFRGQHNLQSMALDAGDYSYRLAANLNDMSGSTSNSNETNAKGIMWGVGYKGFELSSYSSKEDASEMYYGAKERVANGLDIRYKSKNGLTLGFSNAQEASTGTALLKEWVGTTQTTYLRFDGQLGSKVAYGFMTGVEQKSLNLNLKLPKSVGNGEIFYADETKNLNSQNVKAAAYFNMDNLQTQLFADSFDRAIHVSYQTEF